MNPINPLYMMLPYILYDRLVPYPITPPCLEDQRPEHSPLRLSSSDQSAPEDELEEPMEVAGRRIEFVAIEKIKASLSI